VARRRLGPANATEPLSTVTGDSGGETGASPQPSAELSPPRDLLDTPEAGPRAIRGGGLRLASYVAVVLLSVLSSALLFRHLSTVAAGDYLKIVSLVTLTAGLTDAGLAAVGVREWSTRDESDRRLLMRDLTGLRLTLAAAGVAVAVGLAALLGYGSTLVVGTLIAGFGMLMVVLSDTYAIGLTAQLRAGWAAAADLLRQVVMVAVIVALVVAGVSSLLAFYAAAIPAALAAAGLGGLMIHRHMSLLPAARLTQWRALLRETLPYALATAVGAIYFRIAIQIVSLVAGGRQTAYFGVSLRVVESLIAIPVLLVGATFPIFARSAREDRARFSYALGRVFETCWIIGAASGLFVLVGAPLIVSVVAGPRYTPAVGVLRIQSAALAASALTAVWSYALLSLRRHRQILLASLLALAATTVLTATLASVDGAEGAAIGMTVAEIIFMSAMAVAAHRTGARAAISWARVGRVAVCVALATATLAVPDIPSIARLVLAFAIYGGGTLVMRLIPAEILDQTPLRSLRRFAPR
jgi:O-antigen/teichoic acid export membrane protein